MSIIKHLCVILDDGASSQPMSVITPKDGEVGFNVLILPPNMAGQLSALCT